jgi:hypothetical protein
MELGLARQELQTEFWWGNLLKNVHVEDWKRYRRVTLKCSLGKCEVEKGGVWNWLKIVSCS